jgi:hypothetical protein
MRGQYRRAGERTVLLFSFACNGKVQRVSVDGRVVVNEPDLALRVTAEAELARRARSLFLVEFIDTKFLDEAPDVGYFCNRDNGGEYHEARRRMLRVRYVAEGEPMMKAQCHCRECPYVTGGSPNMFIAMPITGFSYTKGAPKQFKRSDLERPVTREFCAECGTHLVTRAQGFPR